MKGKAAKELAARQPRGDSGFAGRCLASALLFLLVVVLSGCHTYPISKNLRQQAQVLSLSQVKANPEGTRGAVVIWGGRIINVVNETNGSSIYICSLPLGSNGKPLPHEQSPGRFIATSTNFIDPEMFPQHGLITVAGPLDGVWTEQLGNVPYPYPVVDIQETHIWPPQRDDYYPYYGYYYPDWGWGWGPGWWGAAGFYYPFYGGYYGYHGYHGYHGGFQSRAGGAFHGRGGGFHGGGGGFHGGGGGGGHGR